MIRESPVRRQIVAPLRSPVEAPIRGFTLIELMVVVLIIAVLLAIAIPTVLGRQNEAEDRSAQSSLRGKGTRCSSTTTAADCNGTKAATATYTSSW